MKKWSLNTWVWAVLAILFFTLLSLGQLQRWQLTPGIAIYGHDVVVMLGILIAVAQNQVTLFSFLKKVSARRWHVELVLLGWIGLGWLAAYVQNLAVGVGILYTARLVAYSLFTVALVNANVWHLLPAKVAGVRTQILGYWAVGVATLYLGLIQYLLIPDTRFLGMIGWDNHYYRLIGPLLDPGFTGMILVITLLSTAALKTKYPVGEWLLKILLTLGIALTYSRASYLALIAGLLFVGAVTFWQKRRLVAELGLILLLGGLILVIPKPGGEGVNLARTSTITSRVTSSQGSVQDLSFAQRLVGRGLFVPEKIESTMTWCSDFAKLPDNLVVLLFSNLGILGLGLTVMAMWYHRLTWKKLPWFVQSAVVATVIHSQFNNTLFQPFIFLILVGLLTTYWKNAGDT